MMGAAVKRGLAAMSTNVLYAAGDELSDFGAPQTTLSVRVAQLSASIGAGRAAEAVLAVG
jgi:hypothetical protein